MSEIKLNTIEEAIEDFKEGKFIIVVDDEDRENEGDLIIAAEFHAQKRERRLVRAHYDLTLRGVRPPTSSQQQHLCIRYAFHGDYR